MIVHQLEKLVTSNSDAATETYQYLHEIAEKNSQAFVNFSIHRYVSNEYR